MCEYIDGKKVYRIGDMPQEAYNKLHEYVVKEHEKRQQYGHTKEEGTRYLRDHGVYEEIIKESEERYDRVKAIYDKAYGRSYIIYSHPTRFEWGVFCLQWFCEVYYEHQTTKTNMILKFFKIFLVLWVFSFSSLNANACSIFIEDYPVYDFATHHLYDGYEEDNLCPQEYSDLGKYNSLLCDYDENGVLDYKDPCKDHTENKFSSLANDNCERNVYDCNINQSIDGSNNSALFPTSESNTNRRLISYNRTKRSANAFSIAIVFLLLMVITFTKIYLNYKPKNKYTIQNLISTSIILLQFGLLSLVTFLKPDYAFAVRGLPSILFLDLFPIIILPLIFTPSFILQKKFVSKQIKTSHHEIYGNIFYLGLILLLLLHFLIPLWVINLLSFLIFLIPLLVLKYHNDKNNIKSKLNIKKIILIILFPLLYSLYLFRPKLKFKKTIKQRKKSILKVKNRSITSNISLKSIIFSLPIYTITLIMAWLFQTSVTYSEYYSLFYIIYLITPLFLFLILNVFIVWRGKSIFNQTSWKKYLYIGISFGAYLAISLQILRYFSEYFFKINIFTYFNYITFIFLLWLLLVIESFNYSYKKSIFIRLLNIIAVIIFFPYLFSQYKFMLMIIILIALSVFTLINIIPKLDRYKFSLIHKINYFIPIILLFFTMSIGFSNNIEVCAIKAYRSPKDSSNIINNCYIPQGYGYSGNVISIFSGDSLYEKQVADINNYFNFLVEVSLFTDRDLVKNTYFTLTEDSCYLKYYDVESEIEDCNPDNINLLNDYITDGEFIYSFWPIFEFGDESIMVRDDFPDSISLEELKFENAKKDTFIYIKNSDFDKDDQYCYWRGEILVDCRPSDIRDGINSGYLIDNTVK